MFNTTDVSQSVEQRPLIINNKYPLARTLDWEVEAQPLYYGESKLIKGAYVLLNNSTQSVLGLHRNSYKPFKNEQFIHLVDKLSKSSGFETIGFSSFRGGQKVLAYLANSGSSTIADQPCKDYMIIGNGHDGKTSLSVGFTNRIYRCENMFSQLSTSENRLIHSQNADIEAFGNGLVNQFWSKKTEFAHNAELLSDKVITSEISNELVANLLGVDLDSSAKPSTRTKNIMEQINEAIERETKALGSNAWGLFNGITYYTTHVMRQKEHIFGNPYNAAANYNRKAYNYCSELCLAK